MEKILQNKRMLNFIFFMILFISFVINVYVFGIIKGYRDANNYCFKRLYDSYFDYFTLKEELHNIENNDISTSQTEDKSLELQVKYDLDMSLKLIEDYKNYNTKLYYCKYKEIQNMYSEYFEKEEEIYDYFDQDDINYLQMCVETEVYGGDFESKVNVANVVFNRLNNDKYPNTLKEVVTSPNQFTYYRNNISEDTKLACEYAFRMADTTNGALSFHSNSKTQTFNGLEYKFTDSSGHHFY